MKRLGKVLCVGTLGLLLGVFPQVAKSAAASDGTVIKATHVARADADAKTFLGVIGQLDGGRYALVERDTNTVYLLDDQEKAKQFAGKSVKVTGSLDASNSTIKVTDIQAA